MTARQPLDMDKPCQVYVVRDDSGAVLYVGQSYDVPRRMRDHRRAGLFAGLAVDVGEPMPRWKAQTAEARLIRELQPPRNIRGKFLEQPVATAESSLVGARSRGRRAS